MAATVALGDVRRSGDLRSVSCVLLCMEFLAEVTVCFSVRPEGVASVPDSVRFFARTITLYAWSNEKCATAHWHACSL